MTTHILILCTHNSARSVLAEAMLNKEGGGRFRGRTGIDAGQWELVIDITRNGERVFRSRNRIILR